MIILYYKQKEEEKRTQSIAAKLSTDHSVTEKVKKIFPSHKYSNHRYKIVYPVKYHQRPMSSINQGDFYAIHVLSLALGFDNIDFIETQPEETDINAETCKGNVIFICTPQVNPVLNSVYRYASYCNNGCNQHTSSTVELNR